jgi:succinyl-diaminopimelate desuccinylase
MLSGHVDVVTPDPDDSQFEPRVEGEYLWGRGAADMKTVLATYLVWLKDVFNAGPPYPPINLMLVGNEENGESEPMGTPHLLNLLHDEERDAQDQPYEPLLFIAGERTGERGNEIWGEVCTQNRGVMRFQVAARDLRMHTGTAANVHKPDLSERMVAVRQALNEILDRRLTISSPDGWQSQVRYPFLHVGEPGVYNISPDYGILGVEVRPIPQDDTASLREELQAYCEANRLELFISVMEEGVVCSTENPFLQQLLEAVRRTSGQEPAIGRKLPGTSARFAPKGQGLVWGQSGIGPHARDERHFIPSIAPYYQALNAYKDLLINNLSTP